MSILRKILITGTSSGLGKELFNQLKVTNDVIPLTRQNLDLSAIDSVQKYIMPRLDMLINCAGTDIGGKIEFVQHDSTYIVDILNTNFIAPILLTQKALILNSQCKIVNITSTNNKRYWPNDLAYSLSKKSLSTFGNMLQIEYPNLQYLEVVLGLTKTNFNLNRYKHNPNNIDNLYSNPHLTTTDVVQQLMPILWDNKIKSMEISP